MHPALAPIFSEHTERRSFRRGQALFVEGDRPERVFLVESGWVLISCVSASGRETVLSLTGPQDVLGEVSAVDGKPRSASATALTDLQVLVAPVTTLTRAIQEPGAATALLTLLAGRLRDADRKRIEFATLDTLGRVATRLTELVDRFGRPADGGHIVDLPLSQDQLASWCAASREATVKALSTLRSLDCVSTGRHTVTVHDLTALRRYAGVQR